MEKKGIFRAENARPVHTRSDIELLLNKKPELRDCLFARGYLVTNDNSIDANAYPFYSQWQYENVGDYRVFVHKNENYSVYNEGEKKYLIVGNAYNPISMKWMEEDLLKDCANTSTVDEFYNEINNWTGAFVLFIFDENELSVMTDASSMKMCNYSIDNGNIYLSSHVQLLADLLDVPMTEYAAKIRTTKMYNTGMRWMPGNTTAYDNIFRLECNLIGIYNNKKATFSSSRFWPLKSHDEFCTIKDYEKGNKEIYELIHNNLLLSIKKWKTPAITLTGGMDSGCTFACSKGITEKFRIVSYDCKDQERKDSEIAKKICDKVNVKHYQYHIPELNSQVHDYEAICMILDHNTSYVMNLAEEEIRKIIVFRDINDYDVELKSDVAEIGRAFYGQKYGMKMPKVFSPRQASLLQTRFLFMPSLFRKTKKEYKKHLEEINLTKPLYNFEHSDLIYWEYRIAASSAYTTLSMGMTNYTMTFPYNNRHILELFLCFPYELRVSDYPQNEIIRNIMPEMVLDEGKVENKYLSKRRVILEKVFFRIRSFI